MEDRYYCPLMEEEIEEFTCFEVHCVISGGPRSVAPEETYTKENWEDICLKCPHHRDDA